MRGKRRRFSGRSGPIGPSSTLGVAIGATPIAVEGPKEVGDGLGGVRRAATEVRILLKLLEMQEGV
jgi:hypothetical protein